MAAEVGRVRTPKVDCEAVVRMRRRSATERNKRIAIRGYSRDFVLCQATLSLLDVVLGNLPTSHKNQNWVSMTV